jgi:hypothetical protein
MPRIVTISIVAAGAALILYFTKPTRQDLYAELQERATVMEQRGDANMDKLVGANPLDEMVITMSPENVMKHTEYADYYLVSVFQTRYLSTSHQQKQVRIYGFLSTFYPSSRS